MKLFALIRGALFNLCYGLSVPLFSIPFLLVMPFMGYQRRLKLFTYWPRFVLFLLRWICGIRWRVEGKEHLPTQPVVFLANHQSTWETLAFFCLLHPVTAVLKKELTYIPIFGWLLRLTRPIVIDRSKKSAALKDILRQGQERLTQGSSVLIFPEGTRVPTGETRPHMPGGAMLAIKSQVNIVPIIHNAGLYWPAHQVAKHPGEIVVKIGAPIATAGASAKTLNQELATWLDREKLALLNINAG